MHIELRPDVQASEGVPVGLLDGLPFVYIGRIPHVAGQRHRQSEIAPALYEAIDRAASMLWGNEWCLELSRVTGLNRRTVTQDRIRKHGLSTWVLVLLGKAAAEPFPRAQGYMLLATAELHNRLETNADEPESTLSHRRRSVLMELHQGLHVSISLMSFAHGERAKHRATNFS